MCTFCHGAIQAEERMSPRVVIRRHKAPHLFPCNFPLETGLKLRVILSTEQGNKYRMLRVLFSTRNHDSPTL